MISETVEHLIPDRGKHFNQHRLAERNPDILHCDVPTAKMTDIQCGLGQLNRISVLAQTVVENQSGARGKAETPFAGTSGNGLTDVNRSFWNATFDGISISLDERCVGLERSGVVDRIDASRDESFRRS